MSDIVDKLDWLSDVTEREETPPLFERKEFFARLQGTANQPAEEYFPFGLFTAIGALSSAAAAVVFIFAMSAWTDLSDPVARGIHTLLEVMP